MANVRLYSRMEDKIWKGDNCKRFKKGSVKAIDNWNSAVRNDGNPMPWKFELVDYREIWHEFSTDFALFMPLSLFK